MINLNLMMRLVCSSFCQLNIKHDPMGAMVPSTGLTHPYASSNSQHRTKEMLVEQTGVGFFHYTEDIVRMCLKMTRDCGATVDCTRRVESWSWADKPLTVHLSAASFVASPACKGHAVAFLGVDFTTSLLLHRLGRSLIVRIRSVRTLSARPVIRAATFFVAASELLRVL